MARIMTRKKHLSNALELAGARAKYDAEVKKILANKIILAWILKYAASEFKEASISEITGAIEGMPETASVPVYPGKSNAVPEAVTGMSTEDKVPNEGEITYDIRFHAYTPDSKRLKLIINVEAQKAFYPGYDLVSRGIFYGARMLSAQMDQEFTADNYNDIKKVYSIWVCMDTGRKAANTITSYRIGQHRLYGDFGGSARYDLMEVVMICLGQNAAHEESKLLRLLDILLTDKLNPAQKEELLKKDYKISPTISLREEMENMCNLSYAIEERGIEKGIKKGIEKGIEKGIKKGIEKGIKKGEAMAVVACVERLMANMNMPLEEACANLGWSVQEYNEAKDGLDDII